MNHNYNNMLGKLAEVSWENPSMFLYTFGHQISMIKDAGTAHTIYTQLTCLYQIAMYIPVSQTHSLAAKWSQFQDIIHRQNNKKEYSDTWTSCDEHMTPS